jgi:hypothetical protein
MLHPELTASATRVQAEQIRRAGAQVHASCNRTCELGMTRAVGDEYSHILELLAEVTGAGDAGRGEVRAGCGAAGNECEGAPGGTRKLTQGFNGRFG